jgi:hypothetical protein
VDKNKRYVKLIDQLVVDVAFYLLGDALPMGFYSHEAFIV